MSPRRRSVAFGLAALAAAAAAAAIADSYGSSVAGGYGPLRPVVVVRRSLPPDPIAESSVRSDFLVRRVPERFVPPDALSSPVEALGLVPAANLPAGSYLLASQLRPPRSRPTAGRALPGRRSAVEVTVSGAGGLLASGSPGEGRVDVVVSGDPAVGGGHTRIAAFGVPLLSLRSGPEGAAPGASAAATLALTRKQALRLIAAESEARRMTLLRAQ